MAIISWEDSGPPAARADIERVERMVGAPLPPDYASLMLHVNGGVPHPNYFQYRRNGRDRWTWIDGIFPIDPSDRNGLEAEIERIGMVDGKLPFGSTADGQLLLGVDPTCFGTVFFRNTSEFSRGRPIYCVQVAGSLEEFLSLMREDPGDEAFE